MRAQTIWPSQTAVSTQTVATVKISCFSQVNKIELRLFRTKKNLHLTFWRRVTRFPNKQWRVLTSGHSSDRGLTSRLGTWRVDAPTQTFMDRRRDQPSARRMSKLDYARSNGDHWTHKAASCLLQQRLLPVVWDYEAITGLREARAGASGV
jgi:hypothetical protein